MNYSGFGIGSNQSFDASVDLTCSDRKTNDSNCYGKNILVKSVKPVPPQKKQSVSSKDQAALSADFHKFTGDIQRLLESASSNINTAKSSIAASIE